MSTAYQSSVDDEFDDQPPADDLDALPPEDESPVSVEERARAMGWKPEAEYRGDPRRWTSAEEFIARGESELPILRDQNRRMSEKLARHEQAFTELRNTVAEQAQAVRDAMELARRSDERGYQRALAELKAEQRQAVEGGDTVVYDQVQERIDALEQTRAAVVETAPPPRHDAPPPPPATAAPPLNPAIQAFIDREAGWFNDASRAYLRQAIIGMHTAVIAEHPTKPESERLELALERLKRAYPDQFDEEPMTDPRPRTPPNRPRAPPAMPPRSGAPTPRSADPFLRIDAGERADARKAYENMKRHDDSVSPDEYVALYENPRLDILQLRRQRKAR